MPPACGQQKCKLEACATFGLFSFAHPSFIIPTGAKHGGGERSAVEESLILLTSVKLFARLLFCHFDRSAVQSRNLFILVTSVKLSARPLFCHFDRSAV